MIFFKLFEPKMTCRGGKAAQQGLESDMPDNPNLPMLARCQIGV